MLYYRRSPFLRRVVLPLLLAACDFPGDFPSGPTAPQFQGKLTVEGYVTDASGSPIDGAFVSPWYTEFSTCDGFDILCVRRQTHYVIGSATVSTDSDGYYSLSYSEPNCPSHYRPRVVVRKLGFQQSEELIQCQAARQRIDITLFQ